MKKFLSTALAVLMLLSGCNGYETAVNAALDNFKGDLSDLKNRIEKLEQQCKSLNSAVSSLTTLVNALEDNDYVTAVTPIMENGKEVGYYISFKKSGTITIYHGQDGEDGQDGHDGADGKDGANGKDGQDGANGADGKDGHTPVIGVDKDTDGIYYWTIDGQWLTDKDGNKIRVTGEDGKDGQNGADGKDGANGADGKDGQNGQTPMFKIENGYWYISYNSGATWSQLGKATGEDGEDGANGADGKDGANGADGKTPQFKIENGYWFVSYDNGSSWEQIGKATGDNGTDGANGADGSNATAPKFKVENEMWYISYDNGQSWEELGKATVATSESIFKSVTEDDTYVYFTLNDGTVITIQKAPEATLARLQSVTFVPRYKDGKATVTVDANNVATATLDYMVFPKSVATALAAAWDSLLSVQAVQTATRVFEFVEMPVTACTADADKGIITVTASAANLPAEFYTGQAHYSAALFITDAENTITSDFVALYTASAGGSNDDNTEGEGGEAVTPDPEPEPEPELPEPDVPAVEAGPNNSISYTTSDTNELMLYTEMGFGANIVSTTYDAEKREGTFIFDGDITRIPTMAFKNCLTLVTVTLPGSITKIEDEAFYECKALTAIDIPNTVQSIGISAFYNCIALKSANLGTGVTSIADYAFKSCSALESITIPESVTTIGSQVFMFCSGLTAFYGKFSSPDKRSLIIDGTLCYFAPAGVTEYTVSNTATVIGMHSFYDFDELTSITIPNTVTDIKKSAFCECSNLAAVNIGKGVTTIGHYAFHQTNLKTLTIPDNVTSIGDYAFKQCYSLTTATIGHGVQTIGQEAFYECKSLSTVTIGNGVEKIGKDAFNYCTSMTGITIGTGIVEMGESTFYGCNALNRVDISDLSAWCNISFGYKSGDYWYYSDSSNPLYYAKNLYLNGTLVTRLVIPSDVTIVKDRAFKNADCLKVVTIHDNVTWIEYGAFDDCDELTNVSIGSGILKIFDRAFYSCNKLGLVYCKAVNPPTSGYRMFHDNASGRKIYVPSASVDAYKPNSYWRDYSDAIYGYDF